MSELSLTQIIGGGFGAFAFGWAFAAFITIMKRLLDNI
jgi:hypothetical protein